MVCRQHLYLWIGPYHNWLLLLFPGQHLYLWIGPYHNWLLLLFPGRQGAARAHVLPGTNISISASLIINCGNLVYQSCGTTACNL